MAKKRGIFLVALSLLMAISAAWTANRWITAKAAAEQGALIGTHVVAAAMAIPYGTKVEGRHLKYVEIPEGVAPIGFFTSYDDVKGRVSTTPISRGEILIEERFAAHDAGSTLAALVGENMRAVAVRVNDVVGVAGFLLPGNRVDVVSARKSTDRRVVTETILKNIKVLAVDQTAATDTNEPLIVRAVTLEVTPKQAETLVQARTEGQIQLTLRNPMQAEPKPEPQVVAKPAPPPRKPSRQRPRRPTSTTVTVIRGTQVEKTKTKTGS
jgi:pilus assembly protein CpaB